MIAQNGEHALDLVGKFKPDLVITDVVMPVMDGLQFTESLRKTAEYCHVPVIVISAKATTDDIRTGIAAGANEYLKKPCSVEQLIESITKLLPP
jgi:CheY-like chemotaxis protein